MRDERPERRDFPHQNDFGPEIDAGNFWVVRDERPERRDFPHQNDFGPEIDAGNIWGSGIFCVGFYIMEIIVVGIKND